MSPLALIPLLLLGAGEPYVRLRVDTSKTGGPSHCLWWAPGPVELVQASQGTTDVEGTGELAAVSRSIATWRTAFDGCGSLRLAEAAATTAREIGYDEDGPNQNRVLFRSKGACSDVVPDSDPCWDVSRYACANAHDCWPHARGALAITTSTFESGNGRIHDADVELNAGLARFTVSDGPRCLSLSDTNCTYYDVENTATHEVGHVVGLDHSPNASSTMYATAPIGETSKRALDADSVAFVCEVYPAGSYARDCIVEQLRPELEPTGCAAVPALLPPGAALMALVALSRRRRR